MGTLVKNGINYTGAEGGSTTPTNLNGLTDVEISSPVDGQGLVYDSSIAKWKNGQGGVDTAKVYLTDDATENTLADDDKMPFYDTSASAKKNTTWGNVKSLLGMPVMGTFSKGDLYDTTEKVIGKWTDGRPLYQRTFVGSISSSSTQTTVVSSISSWSIKDLEGMIWSTVSGQTYYSTIPYATSTSASGGAANDYVIFYTNGSSLILQIGGTSWKTSSTQYSVTVRYTKSSDSANSYNYSSENDYSTSEHIIGTWVNGETLYQRTFTGSITVGDAKQITSFSYGSKVKEMKSIAYSSSANAAISGPTRSTSTNYFEPYFYNGYLYINTGSDFSGYYYVVTVKYIH